MRLGHGKFKNHTAQKRGRRARNNPVQEVDELTPLEAEITVANVPFLQINSMNNSECPKGWIAWSDCEH